MGALRGLEGIIWVIAQQESLVVVTLITEGGIVRLSDRSRWNR
jgi:hypothetical protein